jgi:hypothetical protein
LILARQAPASLQRSGTRTNIPVQQLLKEEAMANVKEDQEEKESSPVKKPPPGAVKMPGADDLAGALKTKTNEEQDEADALLAQLKAI